MPRVIEAFAQFFDGEGAPLVDGWLRFLESGSVSTDKNTYSDIDETIANANPVQLDAEGRCPNVFGTGSYRVISYTNDEVLDTPAVQIQEFDPVPGGTASTGDWAYYSGAIVYSEGDIVKTTGGKYYVSLENNNTGNAVTDTTYWHEMKMIYVYNATVAYKVDDIMLFTDDALYICTIATTAGETPVTTPGSWDEIGGSTPPVETVIVASNDASLDFTIDIEKDYEFWLQDITPVADDNNIILQLLDSGDTAIQCLTSICDFENFGTSGTITGGGVTPGTSSSAGTQTTITGTGIDVGAPTSVGATGKIKMTPLGFVSIIFNQDAAATTSHVLNQVTQFSALKSTVVTVRFTADASNINTGTITMREIVE